MELVKSHTRAQVRELRRRLREPRRFLQVLAGARQVGKTTAVLQALGEGRGALRHHFASADEPVPRSAGWLEEQWNVARALLAQSRGQRGVVLALDEVQKIPRWSEAVKRLWDEDTRRAANVKVVLLGSAPLLMQQGLTESLAGRFEIIHLPHWSFAEMRSAFDVTLDEFLFYGAYPGAAPLIKTPRRWSDYIVNAIIETTLSRDVLLLSNINKPALLRQVFELGCVYSGQLLSYNKMLGRLQESGNTSTLAHYLELLAGAGLVTGLRKYAGSAVRQKRSIPKLQVLNTALMTAFANITLAEARADRAFWGRLVESAVGAHIAGAAAARDCEAFYWRHNNREVDFVVRSGRQVTAIEVKSGRRSDTLPGMAAFERAFPKARKLLVGADGLTLQQFLAKPVAHWVR